MTNNASVIISGGKGTDTLLLTGSKLTSNPIFSREKFNEVSYTKFTVVDKEDGSPLAVTAFDDVEILTFNDSSNNSIYFLTEDIANGRIRRVDGEEMVWRTVGSNSDWADNKLDTYTAYQQYENLVNLPTYNVATSSSLNEGETINVDISTTSVAPGTNLYYSLSGAGISFNDFSSGFLSDTYDFGTVGTDGKLSLGFTIANDFSTEGTEALEIKLFSTTSPVEKLSSGVERSYLIDVSGVPTKFGDTIYVRYLGKLFNGTVFDQNIFDRKKSQFSFQLGAGSVIKGWDIGLLGVNVGDVLILSIPADQAYGKNAVGSIPANSPLKFAVQVLGRTDARGSEKVTDTTPDLSLSASKQVGATATVAIKDTSVASAIKIENNGAIELMKGLGNKYSAQSKVVGAINYAIKKDGNQIYQGIYGNDWSVLAAETVNGVNQVLWKNTAANRLHLWKLDGNWNWQSSSLWDEASSSIGQQLETEFEIDLDGNGTVAVASAAKIENIGSLKTLMGTINNDIITGQGGEIVYGGKGSDRITGQSKISADGTRRIPSFLTGGSGDDTYVVPQGVFSVILDAGDGLDTVNMSGSSIDNIQFIRVNQRDIYAADATTSLLLIDPQGIEGKYNAIESFIIGNNKYGLTQLISMAFGSSNFYGDYTYRELQSNGFFDLGIVGLDPLSINGYIQLAINNNKLTL
ncbi:hypothetical protein C7K08_08870 [Synechococcus lacustris str. Tous]|uniref:peptidylprolyl isomerase n=2 Tax=Synechococcus TaxID=1129 RepID=A0A2P7EDT8_9SYNE|nr:hypothetical protein C7K08_08870 [Synechococcus lacustris str. Tous]